MKTVINKFGTGVLFDVDDLVGSLIYFHCTACMSIWSETLTWCNAHTDRITTQPELAAHIVVLSCQVTDLAVLNDIRTIERFHELYPNKSIYVGGCLAKRFDIELPSYVLRLNNISEDKQTINSTELITFEKPFWVKDFKEDPDDMKAGNLFRNHHPIRIGVGCSNKCTYCTIRDTRGDHRQINQLSQVVDFIQHRKVVLIADNPEPEQLLEWMNVSRSLKKGISFRNVEPTTAVKIWWQLCAHSQQGLLTIFHCPIQSADPNMLHDMKRNVKDTMYFIDHVKDLQTRTRVATNVIVDYKDFPNEPWLTQVNELFDYVSWNPYWDGTWNRSVAEERWNFYSEDEWKLKA